MLRLNLTNKPGLQDEEELAKIDLEGLTPERPPEEQLEGSETLKSPDTPAVLPEAPLPPPIEDEIPIQPIDKDLFKLAEVNLDLIEQAEQEEFTPKHPSPPLDELEEKPAKVIQHHPLLRYGLLAAVIVVIIGVLWAYKNGLLTKGNVRETTQIATEIVSETVSEQATDLMEMTEGIPGELSEKAVEAIQIVPEATGQINSHVSDVVQSARSVRRVFGPSEILIDYIRHIQFGHDRLKVAAEVLTQFPAASILQYLRVKNDKVSFILYVKNEYEAKQIKKYFIGGNRFQAPVVFFIERTGKIVDNPVEIMTIVRFNTLATQDSKGYKYYSDRRLSQYVWQAGVQSRVNMNPLQISNRDVSVVRNAQIAGNGSTANVIQLLNELSSIRDNMGIGVISITSKLYQPLAQTQLDYKLNTIIYPNNM
ncbi:MAG: hypothetical protein KAT54_08230 [Candidatus Marinimicrobia bacterium]|nr:hypothetical protein [Candidatus Neomarinimicrobiota bacterium]